MPMETMTQALWLTDYDLHLFAEGTHRRIYEKLGAHLGELDGRRGVHFAIWAPDAEGVSAIGDFNGWQAGANPLWRRQAGVWEGFVPNARPGELYKYRITWRTGGADQADPYGWAFEAGPQGASRIWDLDAYGWSDGAWMAGRGARNCLECPISIYEVHLGSWRRLVEEGNRPLTYREIAPQLADYVHDAGYTHVEFLPVTGDPLDGSLGYQPVAWYAPHSRLGTPDDFKYLVDCLHQREIGVILDFQAANARFWLEKYHVDGVRMGAAIADAAAMQAEFPGCLGGLRWSADWRAGQELAENVVLALPHEEVMGRKGSLVSRMTGDEWRKFANLRLLFGQQFGHPGKKLIFMGSDFGQWSEWRPDASLDWHWLPHPLHAGLRRWVRDLNTFYRGQPSLVGGFERVEADAFLRRGTDPADVTLFVLNFTAIPRSNYRVGVPLGGYWAECLNSDAVLYGGSGQGNIGGVEAVPLASHGRPYSLNLTLPPLGALVLRSSGNQES
jgi:1,4-alpha-glucan branching enzyme